MTSPAPFDALAPDYDARFTDTVLGQVLRRAVWRWLDRAFTPGERVLELACGTGEDAIHLARRGVGVLATDSSQAMLDVARAKIEDAGLTGSVELRSLGIEQLDRLAARGGTVGTLDGAFSNFGGLNCVSDLAQVARSLAALLVPGARVVLCVMGPLVPWEWGWYLAHGVPGRAFRRLTPGGTRWRGLAVRYPSIGALCRVLAEWFVPRRRGGLGVLVPPSYVEPWAQRHQRLVRRLDRWERAIEEWPVVPWLGDHYLLEVERR